MSFVHLHNHTQYSLLDGAIRIKDFIEATKKLDMSAVAMTDHGNMFGTIPFYQGMKKAGIKPIIGFEAYVAPRSRLDKEGGLKAGPNNHHLILLARNLDGYRNLMKLSSIGYTQGFYYKPRIDREVLEKHSKGLICLSACIKGEVPWKIIQNDYEGAKKDAIYYRELFGDNYYLEIQDHGIPEEKIAIKGLINLSKDLDIPLVATNDCHYLKREYSVAQDILICIQTGKDYDDPRRLKFSTDELYFKSEEEMNDVFPEIPEALAITAEIADKCDVTLDFDSYHLPVFQIPEAVKAANLDEYLEELAIEGMHKRYSEITPELEERLHFELDIIKKMGFPGYFLITMDFIKYARDNGIPVGPGRGSAAGSLVSYCTEITNVDPIRYGLLFERFLNPERVSMPDIDIDFCYEQRENVIDYVREKYGHDNVTQIITFGSMNARGVIRDVGRVLQIPYSNVDAISKLIPTQPGTTLNDAYTKVKEFKDVINSDERHRLLYDTAIVLEGLSRHASTHAAGVVIAPGDLTDYIPLYKQPQGDLTTQFAMKAVEEIGLLKMDFLGLRTLTVIDHAIKALKEKDININIDEIPLDDSDTFDIFANGETIGIFQFESSGMREYLRKLKPDCIEDLTAMNALYRPGPMDWIDDFIDRKQERVPVEYLHPLMEEVLKETYGIIVYQEQVMQIAARLGGFSLGKADVLRKAMGKKIASLMAEQKIEFIKGAAEKNIPENDAKEIFAMIDKFAGYGFNKSHATCYSIVAYQTAYLKAHHPAEFMAANLTSEMGNSDRVVILIDECKRMGIDVLPPDINKSGSTFIAEDSVIRFGLCAVKNIGLNAIQAIIVGREKVSQFKTLFDFCKNINLRQVNRKVIESLIQVGAMDSLKGHRAQLLGSVDVGINYGQAIQQQEGMGQYSMFGEGSGQEEALIPLLVNLPAWTSIDMLQREKDLIGIYVSGHPLQEFKDEIEAFARPVISHLSESPTGLKVMICGLINDLQTRLDRKNNTMAFFNLEDFSGSVRVLTFSSIYENFRDAIQADNMVMVRGKLDRRDGREGFTILADEIIPLAQVRDKFAKRLSITMSADSLNDDDIDRIHMLLNRNPGTCRILICVKTEKGQEILMRSKTVSTHPSPELIRDLREILGHDNVWIEG
ncbi:DNA polymerase III subunit alpha [bacterium]|nr:DNA polymerase III subunit alpha [bacterium]